MRRLPLLLGAALLAALVLPTVAPAATPAITVMSRNIYLGADVIRLGTATTPAEQAQSAATLFDTALQTNFPERAVAIAAEARKVKPDIIGVQEAARFSKTADGAGDGPGGTAATDIVQDFVSILQAQLKKEGLSYKVAVVQDELDTEVATNLGFDARLTQRDAILVRTGKGAKVKVKKALKGHYADAFAVPLPDGQTATVTRGWEAIDATSDGVKFRFVNTHLEAYSGTIGQSQARELTGRGGPAGPQKQGVILVGDMNSDPRDPAADARLPYEAVVDAGYVNALPRRDTCCQTELVNNPVSELKQDIDYIFTKPKTKVLKTGIVGNKASDRTPTGLWPSDHAGVWAQLNVPG